MFCRWGILIWKLWIGQMFATKFQFNVAQTMSLIEPTCRNVLLTMLPKSRDSTQPNYCRPIVVLKFTNKMLSNLLYGRPHATLHMEQCFDETGFKPHTGIDDAMINAKSKWPDNTVSFFSHRMEQIPPRDHTTTHNVCHYIRCKLNPIASWMTSACTGQEIGTFLNDCVCRSKHIESVNQQNIFMF